MNVITVSQVNTYIKALLDESTPLRNIYVVGEISNFLHYRKSGHMYFTLKDEKSQIKAVMFSSYAQRLKFRPEDGMRVICRGRISCYEKDGIYQIYAEDMQPDGLGALNLAYEQLKDKLDKEGLFDSIHKKSLPEYPSKIGVATSNMGAAIEDIKNITKRRYPLCELVIVPTAVQGIQATDDIVRSLKILDSIEDIDVIIVGRGGGSIEDLWAFNTEEVARAVFNCRKPVISAVGHETDFTICDFVADLRAPTPSAAAELAVPDINSVLNFLESAEQSLSKCLIRKLESEIQRLDMLENNSVLSDPKLYYSDMEVLLNDCKRELTTCFKKNIDFISLEFAKTVGKLDALSPLAVLGRGYCIAENPDGRIVKSRSDIKNKVKLTFSDGSVNINIDEVNYE